MTIWPVIDTRRLNLPSIFGAESPFIPRSRTKPRTLPSSSFAQTTKTSAIGEFVIHVLAPSSTQPPGTRRARVLIAPGSDPASGSVSPKQPTSSPVASRGRYFCRCASLPNAWMGNMTRLDCTLAAERYPESTRSISRATRP